MVAGKVKAAMGFQKPPKPSTPAQVQPKPPDPADLIRAIERLSDAESRLRTQLLEHNLLMESAAIVPFLEREIASRDHMINSLQENNHLLLQENTRLAAEVEELKRAGLIEASAKSNLLKNLRKVPKQTDIVPKEISTKPAAAEAKAPWVPKPPPLSSSVATAAFAAAPSTLPPPPPPPPPLKKRLNSAATFPNNVRRVPEVVEFYHSLMRRDTKREAGSGAADATSAATARDMIGEIENRSAHLLAVSFANPVTASPHCRRYQVLPL